MSHSHEEVNSKLIVSLQLNDIRIIQQPRERYVKMAISKICEANHMPPELFSSWIGYCWQAWESHPQYNYFYSLGFKVDILKPQVMGVWQHAPGRGEHTESYVIGTPQDVLASEDWGYKTFGGQFIGLYPIVEQAPISQQRIATWMFSYKGAGGAAAAREKLRKLLPKKVGPWITRARSANSRPKWKLYPFQVNPKNTRHVPDKYISYKNRTKAQVWLDEVLPDDIKPVIQNFMTLDNFWKCSTGKVHPNDILKHMKTYQLGFDF